jgi:ribosome-associated protein
LNSTVTRRQRRSPRRLEPTPQTLAELVLSALDDAKALEVRQLDVGHLTTVTDLMVFASGRSDRHVRSVADALIERCRQAGYTPLGIEGQQAGEWVLVDLGDVVVHVMLPRIREFYNIEKLWDMSPGPQQDAGAESEGDHDAS